jgi:hypothetical protein
MQAMFGGDNAEIEATPEPPITTPKEDETSIEVNNIREK